MEKNLVFSPETDGMEWKVYSFKCSLTIIHSLCRFTKTQLNSNFLLSKLQSQGCLLQAAFSFVFFSLSLICTKCLQLYPWNKNRQEVCLNVAPSPAAACQLPFLISCHLLASSGIELTNQTFLLESFRLVGNQVSIHPLQAQDIIMSEHRLIVLLLAYKFKV